MILNVLLLLSLVFAGTEGLVCIESRSLSKIVNGMPATLGEFPSQLSLQYYGKHICGATILSTDWALTAAHCVKGISPRFISLIAGTIHLSKGGSSHKVKRVIVHPDFKDETAAPFGDIALIKVWTPFRMGRVVKPAKLPSQGRLPKRGSPATVIGWGRLKVQGRIPDTLQKVTIAIVDQQTCNKRLSFFGHQIHEYAEICAGDDLPKDACNGDSGGPLFVNRTLVGLVSWGLGCAQPGIPGVYTRVSMYRNWIKENTGV